MNHLIFDKKRVISFSDAIFSIAITLLVLEISIPSYKLIEQHGTWVVLQSKIPSFIGLVVSFFVIALYWVTHMRITKYVSTVNNKLLWLNIFLLLFIVLLPFSTAFYVGSFNLTGPFIFYCFNLSSIALINYLMIKYIIKKENGQTGLKNTIGKWEKARAMNSFWVWIFSGIMAFIFPTTSRYLFLLIFLINPLINRVYIKKGLDI
ncbi:DUF1211 domain-containing protein [Olleya aquimaris]|uniref:DUF1211 domain-containing protein n=1 Tax=Olleya sediminilitoris TaxID=2795739 RepID=A0ABS1WNG7_9FLAO|nr:MULTISPECIES: TMEM175 family protein [Olleya]AXO80953.1 DUF1211 domain-containing protein [Olleya aquimaris]MBL7560671.1 DUF1211 domain-containing protein [Olleya sediminilitoris]